MEEKIKKLMESEEYGDILVGISLLKSYDKRVNILGFRMNCLYDGMNIHYFEYIGAKYYLNRFLHKYISHSFTDSTNETEII